MTDATEDDAALAAALFEAPENAAAVEQETGDDPAEPALAAEGDDQADPGEETEGDEPEHSEAVEEPQTFAVKVDGREMRVTLDELTRGYSGQAFIQKGMQEVATTLNAEWKGLFERLEPVVASFCPALAAQPYHLRRYLCDAPE